MALSDIEVSGEADFAARVHILPTGDRGNSEFAMPTFLLNLDVPLKEANLLKVQLEGGEDKSKDEETLGKDTARFGVEVREAYLDLVSLFENLKVLRLGLVPQPWQEAQYEDWEYRFLGRQGYVMTEKYKYLNYSDMGLSFMAELPKDLGEWAFSIMNGEGRNEEEVGPHKDFGLFVRFEGTEWSLSLNYLRGSYDNYSEEIGLKERAQGMVLYKLEDQWLAGLEYLYSQDPANVITTLKMADGVDVTGLAGQAVRGQGASLFTQFATGPKAQIMLRYDYLLPVMGDSSKNLNSVVGALSYQVTDDVRSALSIDHTTYGEDYGVGVRESSSFELAAQVLF